MTEQVKKLMKSLDISEAEALEEFTNTAIG